MTLQELIEEIRTRWRNGEDTHQIATALHESESRIEHLVFNWVILKKRRTAA